MEFVSLNKVNTYAPSSRDELIEHAFSHQKILVAINAEKILHATDDSRAIINRNLGYPDGIGAVWALRKKGFSKVHRIPGCELWLDVVLKYYQTKSFYLIGSAQNTIDATIKKLRSEFPGIKICNYRNGYIKSKDEEAELARDIVRHQPDIVFVAMGSPKQELFMMRLQQHHQAFYQGLGGSFDVYTDTVKRAPTWWLRHNLEWAYRLIKQPFRIKRQIHLIRFFCKLHLNQY